MTKSKDLQQQLHDRADRELGSAVIRAFDDLDRTLNALPAMSINNTIKISLGKEDDKASYNYRTVTTLLRNSVIDRLQDSYREGVVRAFIDRVDGLQGQLDELREETEELTRE